MVSKAGGYTVEVLAHWSTEEEAFEHEKFLIACFRDLGIKLCNMTDGGDGSSGHKKSPEVRAKISSARKGKKRPPFSEEWLENMAKGASRAPRTEEVKAKISAAKTGVKRAPFSPEWRAKLGEATRLRYAERRTLCDS